MNQAIVNTGKYTHNFKTTDNWIELPMSGCQSSGQAESLTDFVLSLQLETQWIPYGYGLYFVYHLENSKNYTAYLLRTPAQ